MHAARTLRAASLAQRVGGANGCRPTVHECSDCIDASLIRGRALRNDVEQLYLEHQRGALWHIFRIGMFGFLIAELGRNDDRTLAAYAHALHAALETAYRALIAIDVGERFSTLA